MDDMFLQCNKNTIYVLNSTYRYGEFDMIGLFGSAAGRAIANHNATNTKNNQSSRNNCAASKAYKSLSNMTAKSKSLDYELIHEKRAKPLLDNINNEDNLAKIHNGKKSKFWKIFESDKVNKNSLEDISTASSKNSVSKSIKSTCKSSKELYREAAEILGLSCTLSDNCRCLDCQSGYFDCDDSDSMSDMDMSYMDEYEATNFMLMEDNATMYDIIEAPQRHDDNDDDGVSYYHEDHQEYDDNNDKLNTITTENVECLTNFTTSDKRNDSDEQLIA